MTRRITPDDKTLWHRVVRTIDAWRPVTRDEDTAMPPAPVPDAPKKKPPSPSHALPAAPKIQGQEVDIRTQNRLKRGQIPIEATLDLHGHRVRDAYLALRQFIIQSHGAGLRCILVIHGKGSMTGEAKIKAALAGWLAEWSDMVLTHAPGRPEHGGAGVTYILLRRKRL